ncbi:MAG: hypothetical protein Tsb002_21190 [Wenzhouxiangellaceae bacterium]
MPLPVTSLSSLAASVAAFLRNGLQAGLNNISVTVGAPALAAVDNGEHRLNLFFYRFEPSGMQPDTHPNDPWRLRLFCLITAFGVDEDGINGGENELRMLGEVLRLFHQTPILAPEDVAGESVRLQVVFIPVSDDRINQIWATQNDVNYRPSLMYEMALAPVMPQPRRLAPPRVGGIGAQVDGNMDSPHAPYSGQPPSLPVPAVAIDITDPRWTPSLCWVYQGECAQALSFDVDSAAFAAFNPAIWLAGDPGDNVQLVWQTWDSANGWQNAGAPQAAQPFSSFIDPDQIPPAQAGVFPRAVVLPIALAPGETAAQAQLHATRLINVPGQGPLIIRSAPILISLYRSAP